jgi:glycosyltransferase involved in cell wall biosynthesis
MRIGMIVASLSRRGGGVSLAVRELTRALVRKGVEVEIFAGEDAFSAKDQPDWQAMEIHVLPVVGPPSFGYQPSLMTRLRAARLDCVHLHGLWMYGSLAAHRMSRCGLPTIISPHGMLDPWALGNSAWKKRVAWATFERFNVRDATTLHALNASEAEAFHTMGLKNRIEILPNGIDPGSFELPASPAPWENVLPMDARKLLFLGRIHPKKGIFELIEGFSRVATMPELAQWHLVIAGWDDGGHLVSLKSLTQKHGLSQRVHFIGPVFSDAKTRVLQAADGFILPSFSEGLPIAVLEAWAAGTPTIISPQCNLDIAFSCGASLQVLPDPESIAAACLELATMPLHERTEMVGRAKNLITSEFSWEKIAIQMIEVYQRATGFCPTRINQNIS